MSPIFNPRHNLPPNLDYDSKIEPEPKVEPTQPKFPKSLRLLDPPELGWELIPIDEQV